MVIVWQVCRLIAPYGQRTGSSSDNSSCPYSPYDRPGIGSSFYHSSRYYSPYYHRSPSPYTQTSQSMPTFGTMTSDNSSCPYSSYDRPRTGSSSDNSSCPYSPYGHRRTGSVPTGHHSPSPYTQTSQSIPTFGTTTSDNSSCPYSSYDRLTTHRVLTPLMFIEGRVQLLQYLLAITRLVPELMGMGGSNPGRLSPAKVGHLNRNLTHLALRRIISFPSHLAVILVLYYGDRFEI